MIRYFITACAGVAMTAGVSLAADVSGEYVVEAGGHQIAVTLEERDGRVEGQMRSDVGEIQLSGVEQDGAIRGVWQSPTGEQVPFAARVSDSGLDFSTSGMNLSLPRTGQSPPEQRQDPAADPTTDAQPPADNGQQDPMPPAQGQSDDRQRVVRMERGQIFARPVPQGWQSSESCNEVSVVSPDQLQSFGFTGYEGVRPMTPEQFMQWMIVDIYKHGDFKILQRQQVPSAEGGVTTEAIVSFTTNGVPATSWIRCNVLTLAGSSNGYMLITCAPPRDFAAVGPMLRQLAEKIQITDPNAAFNRAARLGVIQSVKNNPIPDTVVLGYNERTRIDEAGAARRGDVANDAYTLTSTDGTVYSMGQAQYDPTVGGWRDPQNPDRILQVQKHWEGH